MRNGGWWSSVVGGVVGVLLWAGPSVAQLFPSDMLGCLTDLHTCQTDLAACQPDSNHFFGDELEAQLGGSFSYRSNGDGTFTDLNTGLMWEQKFPSTIGLFTWSAASTSYMANLNTRPCLGGFCDWRLPTIKEFLTLVDYTKVAPAHNLNTDVELTGGVPGFYEATWWTSTRFAGLPNSTAWFVEFIWGTTGVASTTDPSNAGKVRAVRGRSSQ